MYMIENNEGKLVYCDSAEYFYNDYIDMYCVVGTTFSAERLDNLIDMWESPELLTEVPMPEYITEDYDEAEW